MVNVVIAHGAEGDRLAKGEAGSAAGAAETDIPKVRIVSPGKTIYTVSALFIAWHLITHRNTHTYLGRSHRNSNEMIIFYIVFGPFKIHSGFCLACTKNRAVLYRTTLIFLICICL